MWYSDTHVQNSENYLRITKNYRNIKENPLCMQPFFDPLTSIYTMNVHVLSHNTFGILFCVKILPFREHFGGGFACAFTTHI